MKCNLWSAVYSKMPGTQQTVSYFKFHVDTAFSFLTLLLSPLHIHHLAGQSKYLTFLFLTLKISKHKCLYLLPVKVKVTQSCPTLCDAMDYSVHGILQAKILEWVAFPFSRGFFQTQGSNLGLPHCRRILYQLSHKGSPPVRTHINCNTLVLNKIHHGTIFSPFVFISFLQLKCLKHSVLLTFI